MYDVNTAYRVKSIMHKPKRLCYAFLMRLNITHTHSLKHTDRPPAHPHARIILAETIFPLTFIRCLQNTVLLQFSWYFFLVLVVFLCMFWIIYSTKMAYFESIRFIAFCLDIYTWPFSCVTDKIMIIIVIINTCVCVSLPPSRHIPYLLWLGEWFVFWYWY